MPSFPRREAEVIELADEMIAGYLANPSVFPSSDVSAVQGGRAAYTMAKEAQVAAQAQLALATEMKQHKLDRLEETMHLQLRKSEVDTVANPEELKLIGWGPKSQPTPSDRPGQPRSLEAVNQGRGTLHLDWKRPGRATGAQEVVNFRARFAIGIGDDLPGRAGRPSQGKSIDAILPAYGRSGRGNGGIGRHI